MILFQMFRVSVVIIFVVLITVCFDANAVPFEEQVRVPTFCFPERNSLYLFAQGAADLQLYKRPFCNTFTGCGRKRVDWNEVPLEDMSRWMQSVIAESKLRHLLRRVHDPDPNLQQQ